MILQLYSIKDELNGFTPLIPFTNESMAKRYMRDQYESNPTIKNTPEDFSIWYICSFDSETGSVAQNGEPRLIERAKNYGSN